MDNQHRLLVWDGSRIEEVAQVAERAVIDFLEQFNGPDTDTTWNLAAEVHSLVEERLHTWDESPVNLSN
jgi:hypothetical protein